MKACIELLINKEINKDQTLSQEFHDNKNHKGQTYENYIID